MNSNIVNIVSIDMGAGALKVWTAGGGLQFLSQVAHPQAGLANQSLFGFSSRTTPVKIKHATGAYWVGEGAHDYGRALERFDAERFTGTSEIRAIVYGALTQLATEGLIAAGSANPLSFVVGLSQDIAEGDKAQVNMDAVKTWLAGVHRWESSTPDVAFGTDAAGAMPTKHAVTVDRVSVTSQARAVYVDYAANCEGGWVPSRKAVRSGDVGVVSIGFNTIELLVVRDGQAVPNSARSEQLGVRTLLASVDETQSRTLGELDITLRRNKLDTSAYFDDWSSQVTSYIRRVWGRGIRHLHTVLVAGGGSILLEDELRSIFGDKLVTSDEPVMCVARGLYKLGVISSKAKA